jgi:hypothetical protein
VREYLHIDQLAEVTPWSESAIRVMISRGVFQLGVHYFKPHGPNSRPIFKWAAVVKFIEEGVRNETSCENITLADGSTVNIDEAAGDIQGLRD